MNNEKWTCSMCTYVNWSASQRCVICQNEKLASQLNQEIYNLNSQNLSDNRNKWACSACTYLNWPKARKCVQCHTARNTHISPILSQQSLTEESHCSTSPKLEKVDKEIDNIRDINKLDDVIASSSDLPLITNDSFIPFYTFEKWTCHSCTYENWPKSKTCVMCKLDRSQKNIDEISPDRRDLRDPIETNPKTPTISSEESQPNIDCQSTDILWLEACTSLLTGNLYAFESYVLAMDGKLDRELSVGDCRSINQPEVFKPGLTLLEVACKLGRDDFIELYLSSACNANDATQATQSVRHRMLCHISPDRALAIQAHLYDTLRMRKGDFHCYVVHDHSTFWLPAEIELLPLVARCQLYDELVDKNVSRELEINERVINWWAQNSSQNRLTALWNRTAGDCLLDSVLQATWGILDRDNILRTALADSMRGAQHLFYPRWREYEQIQARAFNYTINEIQFHNDWQNLLQIACQQGEPLEQAHIFVLCHIIRRPIIVYGVKYINNYRNEPVGLSHFQGVFLPLLWERSFCSRNPIVLGYTRGHFSALVPSESLLVPNNAHVKSAALRPHPSTVTRGQNIHDASLSTAPSAGGHSLGECADQPGHIPVNHVSVCLLPLYDCSKQLLPIHFLAEEETQRSESIAREWLDVVMTRRGYLMARMRSSRRHPLVANLVEAWLDRYRPTLSSDHDYNEESRLASSSHAPAVSTHIAGACSGANSTGSPSHEAHYNSTLEPSTHNADPHI